MTKITEIFSMDALKAAVDAGYVNIKSHPDDPDVRLMDYTPMCQFKRAWDDVTMNARGLIFRESTGEILARPFKKFFNVGEPLAGAVPSGPVIRANKFDGSLGVVYRLDGEFYVSTRGSFSSPQAVFATNLLNRYIDTGAIDKGQLSSVYNHDCTVVMEIIYPENRIVVDYHGQSMLVLLDVIDNQDNSSDLFLFYSLNWPVKTNPVEILDGYSPSIKDDIEKGDEGFVLYWPESNVRMKVKSAEYVALHPLLTETSSRVLWMHLAVNECNFSGSALHISKGLKMDPADVERVLSAGGDWITPLVSSVPDEFHSWVLTTINAIEGAVEGNLAEIWRGVNLVQSEGNGDRASEYQLVKNNKFQGPILALARGEENGAERALFAAWRDSFPEYELPRWTL